MNEMSDQAPVSYAELRARMPAGKWSVLVALIDEFAQSGPHHRELIAAYKVEREAIEREAFKARVRSGGMRCVGNSGRV